MVLVTLLIVLVTALQTYNVAADIIIIPAAKNLCSCHGEVYYGSDPFNHVRTWRLL